MLLDSLMHDLGEVLVRPGPPCEPDQRETRRQQAPVGQVIDRRHQLLGGQVTGDAENHQDARAGNPREPPILGFAKLVGTHHRDHMRVPFCLELFAHRARESDVVVTLRERPYWICSLRSWACSLIAPPIVGRAISDARSWSR